ncbi:UDP-N-acetylglucosamine 1-carboxyvinyltransferase [Halorhodospira halophila]|uniref:UDP-N-acetylglucosamine 1-carboxyvinyltransferase n=1 Tax=Halorhodospira halophila (strain DSM 244 / SL1) TaxID=349124 RepID=A1WV26_HALHL|nr:UDP-N-acetylglucosamine 1-carboxyvinyltransferase [Halorhodospira halophila]ABM61538.1 UDP-N-acetylglucosamine 1-carboxyvinyltransferase [Halorhodospira halophila SL1]MBK1728785.1 UDP-N-acetylglucosamine 1-carboxyvinyltransferase [Halorhodospira halophila]
MDPFTASVPKENNGGYLKILPARLSGTVRLSGAKNAALRHLAASLLTDEPVILNNFPASLLDAKIHVEMLERLGKRAALRKQDCIILSQLTPSTSRLEWTGRSIRNTLLILGALVARTGAGAVPLPGGCKLGERKYDLHVSVLESLGATVWEEDDTLCAEAPQGLTGMDIHLRIRSTGATENAILCGTLARGVTRIWNPHIRPEILDLIELLRKMGAHIRVFGQEHIEVTGVEGLGGAEHTVIADNMEAITWLVGAAISGGDVEIEGFPISDMEVVLAHLKSAGAKIYQGAGSVIVRGGPCYPLEISTGPHPGINSDVQPILAAWAAHAKGESRIIDLRFPGRYAYAEELARMGLCHQLHGDMLLIYGNGGGLHGAEVRALDLRAGAAQVLCGLTAEGETVIHDAWQLLRGYDRFAEKLAALGVECWWKN